MLNKDQYNQDEYNDYYRQEAGGAEIKGGGSGGGIMSKLIMLLVLLALGIAGYFGYKNFAPSTSTESTIIDEELIVTEEPILPQSVQKEELEVDSEPMKVVTKSEETQPTVVKTPEVVTPVEEHITNTVTQEIEKVTSNSKDNAMTPEQIAQVVQMVMMQMNSKQQTTESETKAEANNNDDVELMNELANISTDDIVDNEEADLISALSSIDEMQNKAIHTTIADVDIYNKVNVENTQGHDALSDLSNQISSIVNEGVSSNSSESYTSNLKKEVIVRENEMRIIVVKKGDTLGKIAQRAYGNVMDFKKIYDANPDVVRRADRIYIGQKLRIPN